MSSKENLKDLVKKTKRQNQEQEIEIGKLKDQVEEFELRLRLQRLHCKIFHRQKFSIWIIDCWVRLIHFLKRLLK